MTVSTVILKSSFQNRYYSYSDSYKLISIFFFIILFIFILLLLFYPEEITASFRRFGSLVVDWPHKAESKSYFPPKGEFNLKATKMLYS